MRSSILVVGLIGLFLVGVFEAKAADLEAKLDSKDGTSSFSIKDLDNVEVARINSVGNIQADGTLSVDGTGNSYLMGNLGIGDGSPASLLTVGSGDLFQVNSSGNLVKLNNVTYSWPSTQGGASTVLTNSDGAGTLTWATPAGGDVTGPATSIDNEISLFSGTTGKVIKRATTSGIVKATSGVISAAAAGTDYVAPNAAITGATNTKITYDTKGLVTAGAAAVLASADFANQGTATTVLHGNAAGNPSFGAVVEADITLADNTTNDVSITNHGFTPKAPNNTTLFLRGDGTWATPETVYSGLGYSINVQALTSSPADAATVYFGMLPKVPQTTANRSNVYIRKAGTIKTAEIYCYSGTAGTNESWSLYVRLNNTTDYLIATLGVATNERVFTNAALSIAVVAGDYIEIKGIQPTWATNPATTIYGGYVYIE